MNAETKGTLERRLLRQRRIIHLGAIAVFGGLIFEVWLAYRFPHGKLFLEIWGSVIATAVIAVGVLVEAIWLHRGDATSDAIGALAEQATAEANRLAAEANERAAKTELLTAWRHVSIDKRGELIKFLRQLDISVVLLIEYQAGDPEATSYATEIARVFQEAEIKVKGSPNSYPLDPLFGLYLAGRQEINTASMQVALEGADIPVAGIRAASPSPLDRDPIPNLYIFVAPKTLPPFDW